MKDKINAYFAVLLITIAGSSATLIIVHVATSTTDTITASLMSAELDIATLRTLRR